MPHNHRTDLRTVLFSDKGARSGFVLVEFLFIALGHFDALIGGFAIAFSLEKTERSNKKAAPFEAAFGLF
jgi:hypothetical protein